MELLAKRGRQPDLRAELPEHVDLLRRGQLRARHGDHQRWIDLVDADDPGHDPSGQRAGLRRSESLRGTLRHLVLVEHDVRGSRRIPASVATNTNAFVATPPIVTTTNGGSTWTLQTNVTGETYTPSAVNYTGGTLTFTPSQAATIVTGMTVTGPGITTGGAVSAVNATTGVVTITDTAGTGLSASGAYTFAESETSTATNGTTTLTFSTANAAKIFDGMSVTGAGVTGGTVTNVSAGVVTISGATGTLTVSSYAFSEGYTSSAAGFTNGTLTVTPSQATTIATTMDATGAGAPGNPVTAVNTTTGVVTISGLTGPLSAGTPYSFTTLYPNPNPTGIRSLNAPASTLTKKSAACLTSIKQCRWAFSSPIAISTAKAPTCLRNAIAMLMASSLCRVGRYQDSLIRTMRARLRKPRSGGFFRD